jgi:hypothetical protein
VQRQILAFSLGSDLRLFDLPAAGNAGPRLPLQADLNTAVGRPRSQITALDCGGSIEQDHDADGFQHGRTGAGYDPSHSPKTTHPCVRDVLHISRTRFHVCDPVRGQWVNDSSDIEFMWQW